MTEQPVVQQPTNQPQIPVRLILAIIGLVLATAVAVLVLWQLKRIIGLLLVAGFFAVVLNPAVNGVQRRAHVNRGVATLVVFLLGMGALSGMTYAFVRPIYRAATHFADTVPHYVDQAQKGEGRIGRIVQRYNIDDFVRKQTPKIRSAIGRSAGRGLTFARALAAGIVGLITIIVVAFLMLLEGPGLVGGVLNALPETRRARVARLGNDVAHAITGYVFGNVLISIVAGIVCFVGLLIIGVPYATVLALWVGFADLLPLVGATFGAIPASIVAFLHSTTAGIAVVIMFIVYQQFENHVLQQAVMSRTVNLNPLWVLLSVLIGVELAGLVGALLAIPAAGAVQVLARDLWNQRRVGVGI